MQMLNISKELGIRADRLRMLEIVALITVINVEP